MSVGIGVLDAFQVRLAALFGFSDLIDAALVPSTFEWRGQPECQDFIGQTKRDNATAHREHVRVVVQAGQSCRVQVVAQRGSDTCDLVGRNLLSLSAATEHDSTIGSAVDDGSANADANGGIVDSFFALGSVIVDGVAKSIERPFQMLFQPEPGVIGANRDPHRRQLYYVSWFRWLSCRHAENPDCGTGTSGFTEAT
jgi:hypothetical protein